MRTSTQAALCAALLLCPELARADERVPPHRIDGLRGRAADQEEETIRRSSRYYLLGGTWGHLRPHPGKTEGYRTFGGVGFGLTTPFYRRTAELDVELKVGLSEAAKTGPVVVVRMRPALESRFQAGGVIQYYWDNKDLFDLVDHGFGVGGSFLYTLTSRHNAAVMAERLDASVVADLTLGKNRSKTVNKNTWSPAFSLAMVFRF